MTTTVIYIRPRDPQLIDVAEKLSLTIPTGKQLSILLLSRSEKHDGALWLDADDVSRMTGSDVFDYLSKGLKSGYVDLGDLLIPTHEVIAIWKEDTEAGVPVEL